jgi:hypothetical protein
MPETRLKELAEQKKLLVAKADLNRRMIEFERHNLERRAESARNFVRDFRWPLLAGAFSAGIFGAGHATSLLRWAPLAAGAWKAFKRATER